MSSIRDEVLAIIEIVPVSADEVTVVLRSCFSKTKFSNLLAGITQAGTCENSALNECNGSLRAGLLSRVGFLR